MGCLVEKLLKIVEEQGAIVIIIKGKSWRCKEEKADEFDD